MIHSGTVQLDPAAHAAHTASLRERLHALDVRRRSADSAIETVLTTWHGHAADAFRERWQEWSLATAGVVEVCESRPRTQAHPHTGEEMAVADAVLKARRKG